MSAIKSSPRDFSLFSLFTAGLACLVPFASAYTKPVGDSPKGNPIYEPGLNSIVPAGENFTVTWDPTTEGTVTLVLLKGPSTNAVPQYAIAEKIKNSGSYVWTPSTDLAPQDTGYGIQLIVDSNGQYQYTTQFGISNPNYQKSSSSSSSSTSSTCTDSTTVSKSATISKSATVSATATGNATTSGTITKYASTATGGAITGTGAPSSGYLPHNSSIVAPTGSITVPASLKTTASLTATTSSASATGSSTAAVQTGAAAAMATSFVGFVIAAGVAVLAL